MEYPQHSAPHAVCIAAAIILVFASALPVSHAETIDTVNGVKIEDSTFELYLENRLQKPLAQITAAERELVLEELRDIYALTTQPRAEELSQDPRLRAQIELQYRAALAQAVATDWLMNNPASEVEIQKAYEEQALLAPALQFKARHILVETQAAAVDLIAQLGSGADFEELAKTNSTGPSGPSGGELGWFSPDDMVAPFSSAVALLKDGEYTKSPVRTDFGWHVILREESRKTEAPPLESVRDAVKTNVEQANFQRYLENLRTKSGGGD